MLDVGRIEGEDTLDAHTAGNLADREHLGLARAFDLDNYTAEALHALDVYKRQPLGGVADAGVLAAAVIPPKRRTGGVILDRQVLYIVRRGADG